MSSCQSFAKDENNTNRKRTARAISLRRLVTPQIDLPPNLRDDIAPTILVTTSKGDPLRDDGIDLYKKLKSAVEGDHR